MNALARTLIKTGMAQAYLAQLAGTSQPTIQRLARGRRQLSRKWAIRLAPHLGVTPEYLMFGDRTCPLLGFVGAASEANYYTESSGLIGVAEMPPGGNEDTVAVQIKGDSLGPPLNGWVVYYDDKHEPPTERLYEQLCVISLADGSIFVKKLAPARDGKFDLIGLNSVTRDQSVTWAALVTAMLPPSAVVEESQEQQGPTRIATHKPRRRVAKRK